MDQIVTVTIRRVRQIDRPDGFLGGQADYYAKVRMDGVWMKSGHRHNVPDWRPNWIFRRAVARNSTVPIRIELWDHDSTSGDDECDINPTRGKKRLDLNYRLSTRRITGDLTGTSGTVFRARGAGDRDRAEIWFRIGHVTPRVPRRLTEVWASDLRIKALWNATATSRDLTRVENQLRGFNNRLYNCTDGQWRVGRFLIHDNRSELSATGKGVGHIHRTGTHGAHGHADGRPNNPKHWEVNERSSIGAYLMEFLHSWTGLKDEYEVSQGGVRTNCPRSRSLRDATSACVMDDTYGTPTELCRPETHNPNTEQGNVRDMDCYSWLRKVMHEAGKTRFQVPAGHIAGPTNAPTLRFVYLTILRVQQIDRPEGWGGGQADYYAKVRMDGVWFAKSRHRHDRRVVTPNWIFGFAFSNNAHRTIPIRIVLWDHDTTSGDDLCDISPRRRKKVLDLTYNTSTGRVGGDVIGTRNTIITGRGSGDRDRAEIRFRITSR